MGSPMGSYGEVGITADGETSNGRGSLGWQVLEHYELLAVPFKNDTPKASVLEPDSVIVGLCPRCVIGDSKIRLPVDGKTIPA